MTEETSSSSTVLKSPVFGPLRPSSLPSALRKSPEVEHEQPIEAADSKSDTESVNREIFDPVEASPVEPVPLKRGRGRPAGTRKKDTWQKQGRKAKVQINAGIARAHVMLARGTMSETHVGETFSTLADECLEEGEVVHSYTVQLTRAKAMRHPDAQRFVDADNLEKAQLEALECWRPLTAADTDSNIEYLPSCVIYTLKRDGRAKARLVALGNFQSKSADLQCYSPTVSHAATRALLVEAAAEGKYIGQCDVSNAFIRAVLDPSERVVLRLPEHWGGQRVLLLRSLYGLRIAPRKWFKTFSDFLVSKGFTMNPHEPGLFRRGKVVVATYVDDTLVSAPTQKEVDDTMKEILDQFSGKVIAAETKDGFDVRDILGVRLRFSREKRFMSMDLEQAIVKVAEKFKVAPGRPITTPCVYTDLQEGKKVEYPIRQLIGALQYVGAMARPDVCFAINRVARFVSLEGQPTSSLVTATERIVRYLLQTSSVGIEYSPEREAGFKAAYSVVMKVHKSRDLPSTVAFSDSDYAGCPVTMRSSSGSILYYRGVPILWSSRRQSVLSHSTCEAEYVGLYDTIQMVQSSGFLEWFTENGGKPLFFGDNMSSIALAKNDLPTKKSKHMQLRFHHVKEFSEDICHCPTGLNMADPLTKPMAKPMMIFQTPKFETVTETGMPTFFCCPVFEGY